jgi:hypothetical protein
MLEILAVGIAIAGSFQPVNSDQALSLKTYASPKQDYASVVRNARVPRKWSIVRPSSITTPFKKFNCEKYRNGETISGVPMDWITCDSSKIVKVMKGRARVHASYTWRVKPYSRIVTTRVEVRIVGKTK